jgi:hypothetical protein
LIEVGESEERLDVLDKLQNLPFENSVNLVLGHADTFSRYDIPKAFNILLMPFTLIGCYSQVVFL